MVPGGRGLARVSEVALQPRESIVLRQVGFSGPPDCWAVCEPLRMKQGGRDDWGSRDRCGNRKKASTYGEWKKPQVCEVLSECVPWLWISPQTPHL